jgi:hypothetical protein
MTPGLQESAPEEPKQQWRADGDQDESPGMHHADKGRIGV